MKIFFISLTFLSLVFFSSSAYSYTDDSIGFERNFHEENPVPAIVIEEEVEVQEDAAWTYRFLIPTSVAIAVLVIIGNVIQYFRQVTRKRYKVIEK